MKLKYLIPFIGFFYFIYNDIPHTEDQRPYKPLQGDKAFEIMLISCLVSILLPILTLLYFAK